MDYLEGFLIGPVWSDTDYRSRRHFSAHVLLAAVMASAFVAFSFFPNIQADFVFVKWPLSLVLFIVLVLATPLLSLLYYKLPIYVRPLVIALYAFKYLLLFYLLVHAFLPLLTFDQQTLPEFIFARVDDHISVSLETIAESGGVFVTVAGVVLGGLWVIAEGLAILMILIVVPLCAIGLLKGSQYLLDRVAQHSLEKEWDTIGPAWSGDHPWRGLDESAAQGLTSQILKLTYDERTESFEGDEVHLKALPWEVGVSDHELDELVSTDDIEEDEVYLKALPPEVGANDYELDELVSTDDIEEDEVRLGALPWEVGAYDKNSEPVASRVDRPFRSYFRKSTRQGQDTIDGHEDTPPLEVPLNGPVSNDNKSKNKWVMKVRKTMGLIVKKILPKDRQAKRKPNVVRKPNLDEGSSSPRERRERVPAEPSDHQTPVDDLDDSGIRTSSENIRYKE
ncbi:MAG TPA: hypothetical protein VFD19_01745 [Clostridia bacterium]|nr:hypothetical protein [Clostridia bacterium]